MKNKTIILLIIAAVLIIAAIIYFLQPTDEIITDDGTGITYYPDGSYSYQTQFEFGQINEYTVDANGNVSGSTIQLGTYEHNDFTNFPRSNTNYTNIIK